MKKTLLWIAVLPGAVLAAFLSSLLVEYIHNFWNTDDGWNWLNAIYFYVTWAIKSMVAPVAFCIAGMAIAPSYKRETGVFLIAIAIIYTIIIIGMAVYASMYSPNYSIRKQDYVFFVFDIIGCIISFTYLPKNDEEFKTNFGKD